MSKIRITGGTHRSRLIQVAEVQGLRPTPDRVRETLFNWLGHDLTGLYCLDLFAGSGILGFEAASRGASVTLVERDAKAMQALRKHQESLQLPQVELVAGDALKFMPRQPCDVLFLDPPYGKGLLDRVEQRLTQLVKPEALIYAEAEHPLTALGAWKTVKQGQAGQVYFHLLEQA